MAPEPISTALAIAAGGALAGEVAKQGMEAARAWMSSYLAGHGAEAQRRAEQNTVAFLCDLAKRVDELEGERAGEGPVNALSGRLSDPDFSATLQSALIAAARTGSEEKHHLLARMVSERLAAAPESLAALATVQAVEVIPRLTARQLGLLGVAAMVYGIRPKFLVDGARQLTSAWLGPEGDSELMQSRSRGLGVKYSSWLNSSLDAHGDEWTCTTDADHRHLVSAGCIQFDRRGTADLSRVLSGLYAATVLDHQWAPVPPIVSDTLRYGWRAVIQHINLTPVGFIAGVAVHDTKVGEHTPFDLDTSPFATRPPPSLQELREEDGYSRK